MFLFAYSFEFIVYCTPERTSPKPTSSPSIGKEFVTDEHNEKKRDDDASENELATDRRTAQSLFPDVVPQGATVEHDVPDVDNGVKSDFQ